ncbi:cysteine-rich receptor-like protein kinase 8 [Tanacetum coccineum]
MAGTSTTTTTTTNSDEITSNHPLFLHQTDHPGLFLISKKLTGSDNYSSWKRFIMIALNAKNKMKLVSGEFLEPTMESDLRAIWERNNDMLISWILNTGSNSAYAPLPSGAKAYTMVRQEEKQIEGSNPKHTTATILNSYKNQSRPSTSYSQRFTPQRQSSSNNNSDMRTTVNPNTSFERRNAFRKAVYCGNYGKEGHYQAECYKMVGYPVGHPIHEKYQQPKVNKPNFDNIALRTNNDGHVSARMDQLQNQLNQVLLMLENNQGNITQGPEQEDCTWHPLK